MLDNARNSRRLTFQGGPERGPGGLCRRAKVDSTGDAILVHLGLNGFCRATAQVDSPAMEVGKQKSWLNWQRL